MSLADPTFTRGVGGLVDAGDYLMWRLATTGDLDTFLQTCLDDAAAWLADRAPGVYPPDAILFPNQRALFKRAEAYLALQFAVEPLKARKVFGTHYPLDAEDSDRFQSLIDTEWVDKMKLLIEPYLVVDEGKPFAAPVFASIGPVNLQTVQSQSADVQDILDEANALSISTVNRPF